MEIFDIATSTVIAIGLNVSIAILGLSYKIYSNCKNRSDPIFTIDDFTVLNAVLDDKLDQKFEITYIQDTYIGKQDVVIDLNGVASN